MSASLSRLRVPASPSLRVCLLLAALSVFCHAGDDNAARADKDTRPVKEDAPAAAEDSVPAAPRGGGDAVLTGPLDFTALEMLAIQEGGRKKPLQTHITEQVEQIVGRPLFSGTPYLKLKTTGEKISANDIFFSMWFGTRDWFKVPAVLMAYKPLVKELGFNEADKHFTVDQLKASKKFEELLFAARDKRHNKKDSELTDIEKEAEIVFRRVEMMMQIMDGNETFSLVPHPTEERGTWISLRKLHGSFSDGSEKQYSKPEQAEALFAKYNEVIAAYRKRDAEEFKKTSEQFRSALIEISPSIYPSFAALDREISFNKSRPFNKAWILYFCALALGICAFRAKSSVPFKIVMGLYLFGLALHIYGFVIRCIIAGRPPVSNMYESVIWVGFGCVLFGLIFELIYKVRWFLLCGAGGGFACLVLMDMVPVMMGNPSMPGFESPIKPLVPVLRSNFWLTIHVLTITLSYAAFLLASVLGHATLAKTIIWPEAKHDHHAMHSMVYRAVQIGVFLLATGTILGGVWAYYSWGRFWGWDPKETWAFIALLSYLFVMHGRFTGWWGNFGMSVGSVLCFWTVMFAWYGVNFYLGSLGNGGLHSYGVGAGGEEWVLGSAIVDFVFAGIALTRYLIYQASKKAAASDDAESIKLTETDPVDGAREVSAGE